LSAPELDRELGLEVYLTKGSGVGGSIRMAPEDFVVEEVLVDGSRAHVSGATPSRVLNSTLQRQRFLLCILVKRNWDTLVAVKNVAKQLGVGQGSIQIAGIKDAKAVTAQHVTIDGASMEDVLKVNVKDIQLYAIGYVREALSTYYLLGNHFTIKIKAIAQEQSTVKKWLTQNFKELETVGGIPNFFGHQRFGTTRPITHLVGKALVQGKFEEAAMFFLAKSSMHEHPASRKARQQLAETRDFKKALDGFPRQLRFERLMLAHLATSPTDFIGAFQRLPLKLQELFVQAHQSLLFNRFLGSRLKAGYALDRAVVGDYVVGVERSGLPLTKFSKMVSLQDEAAINERVKAGKMRVALPIIGARQKLSEGVMGQIEQEILEDEGIKLDELRLNQLSRVGGGGGLRTVAASVGDFKFDVSTSAEGEGCQAELSFMLHRGCYATVLLREMMKPTDPLAAGF